MKNSELFNAFIVTAHESNWSQQEMPASMWVRSATNREWGQLDTVFDPYQLLPVAVAMTSDISDAEVMLLMYGWVTTIDKDTLEPTDDEPKKRIRIMLHMSRGKEAVAVQMPGKTLEEFPDIGEGYFTEVIAGLRKAQQELPADDRNDAHAIAQKAASKLLTAIFEEEEQ